VSLAFIENVPAKDCQRVPLSETSAQFSKAQYHRSYKCVTRINQAKQSCSYEFIWRKSSTGG